MIDVDQSHFSKMLYYDMTTTIICRSFFLENEYHDALYKMFFVLFGFIH